MARQICLSHDDYTVAWICAIPLEMAAATAMLDEVHQDLPVQPNDHNSYSLGRICEHNVVIACLPSGKYGTVSASSVVVRLLSSFRSVRFGLMVGIGGGVPTSGADVRLGDIVVSKPTDTHGGVIEYDYGKVLSDGDLKRTGMLSRPPQVLLTALSRLQAHHISGGAQFMESYSITNKDPADKVSTFARPLQEDRLYLSSYVHKDVDSKNCASCDSSQTTSRPSRENDQPLVHYGLIASANQVVKDSGLRDKLGHRLGAQCVEMEAAGVMDNLPCLVIRGICDYADSHKNDEWQGYASAVAAAYAKELLSFTAVQKSHWGMFHVPFNLTAVSAVENFVGRAEELEQLWDYLRPSRQGSQKVAVLHALGGMGKTQLANRFARTYRDDFTAVFWLNSKSRETLYHSLSSVLSRLPGHRPKVISRNEEEVKQNAMHVLKWLALPGNTRWLLIFDNIDQYSPGIVDGYDVGKFFPAADHGSILITSRLLRLSELGTSFPLQKLDLPHSIELLLQSTGLSGQDIQEKHQDVIDIVERLDGLPLAITLAGAFIHETGTSFSKYLQFYRDSWHSLQSRPSPSRHYEHNSILQTWLVSYLEIEKRDPGAAQLMLIFAHFDNQDIWVELLQYGRYGLDYDTYSRWPISTIHDEVAFKEKMRTLIGFSFVGLGLQSDSYTMHPVVRDWCLYIVKSHHGLGPACLKEIALVSVGSMFYYYNESDSWDLQQRLLPHAIYALDQIRSLPSTRSDMDYRRALYGIGKMYAYQWRLEEAEECFLRALAAKLPHPSVPFQESDPFTMELYLRLAQLYDGMARYDVATKIYEDLAAAHMCRSPYDHQTFVVMINLAQIYQRSRLFDRAEMMYQEILSRCHQILGPNHMLTLESTEMLGQVYKNRGRLAMAEILCKSALEAKLRVMRPADITVLALRANLSSIYQSRGKLEKADEMYQASQISETMLETDNPYMLGSILDIAMLYEEMGRFNAAAKLFKQVASTYTRQLGADHLVTLNAMLRLGVNNIFQNRMTEAENILSRVRLDYDRKLGSQHVFTREVEWQLNYIAQLRDPQKALPFENLQGSEKPPPIAQGLEVLPWPRPPDKLRVSFELERFIPPKPELPPLIPEPRRPFYRMYRCSYLAGHTVVSTIRDWILDR